MPVRLTIVTPSYHQAAFLDETLRSVIDQSKYVHEFFVFDGGSTDGSVEIIRRHADRIDHWVSEKDGGQSDAIHKGFSRATGDYLLWLNSDDVLLPGALERVHAALEAHPEWDAVTGYHVRMDDRSRLISAHRIPGESAACARWGIHHTIQQTCFFRRCLYEKVGGLDLSLHCVMDTELFCRMFDAGSIWGHLPHYQAAFRQHGEAKGSSDQWQAKYAEEIAWLSRRSPQYCEVNFKHTLGLMAYRADQIISGRYLRETLDTRRWRGRPLDSIFNRAT